MGNDPGQGEEIPLEAGVEASEDYETQEEVVMFKIMCRVWKDEKAGDWFCIQTADPSKGKSGPTLAGTPSFEDVQKAGGDCALYLSQCVELEVHANRSDPAYRREYQMIYEPREE